MNIPGLYRNAYVARIVEDISYLDSTQVDWHRYTLFEITFFGILRRRFYRYHTNVRYFSTRSPEEHDIYHDIIRPWLHYNDEPLSHFLSRRSETANGVLLSV